MQPLGVFGQLEDLAAIGPLTFENGAGIMQPVGQDMNFCIFPRHELAVKPDFAFELVKRYGRHRVSSRRYAAVTMFVFKPVSVTVAQAPETA